MSNSFSNVAKPEKRIVKFTVEKDTIRFMSIELSTCVEVSKGDLTIDFNGDKSLLNKKNEHKIISMDDIMKTEITKTTVVSVYDAIFAVIAVLIFLLNPGNFLYSAILMLVVYLRTKYNCLKIISNNNTTDIIFDPVNEQPKIAELQEIINNHKRY